MTTHSKLFFALLLVVAGCGGAFAPEPSTDAGTSLIAAEGGPRTDDAGVPEPVPTPVEEGSGYTPPKPPPSRHPPKAE